MLPSYRRQIEKLPDFKDRREAHLQLTDMGEVLIRELISPISLKAALDLATEAEQDFIVIALRRTLRAMQQANKLRSFGVCKTCLHHRAEAENLRRCALTGEILTSEDIDKICREHESPDLADSNA